MNRWLKELLWIGTTSGAATGGLFIFCSDDVIDINVHDTYFVIDRYPMIFIGNIALLLIVYLGRILFSRFNLRFVNYIFIVLAALLVVLLTYIFNFLSMITVEGGWTIYPPLSESPNVIPVEAHEYLIKPCYIIFLQIVLLLLLGYTAFRTGKIQTHK